MMIPYGYKQTEVGVIPEDWDVDNFKNVGIFWFYNKCWGESNRYSKEKIF